MAALCHFYPGYTMESLRAMRLRDFNVLVDVFNASCEEIT